MKPRLKVITLGVDELTWSLAFYRDGLGLPSKGHIIQMMHQGSPLLDEIVRGSFRRSPEFTMHRSA